MGGKKPNSLNTSSDIPQSS